MKLGVQPLNISIMKNEKLKNDELNDRAGRKDVRPPINSNDVIKWIAIAVFLVAFYYIFGDLFQ